MLMFTFKLQENFYKQKNHLELFLIVRNYQLLWIYILKVLVSLTTFTGGFVSMSTINIYKVSPYKWNETINYCWNIHSGI